MLYCCVPFCTSKYGKSPGISFHEIPANLELRKKWLIAISRKDWTPNDRSNTSRICSIHFLQTDYKKCGVRARLLETAVPSVFPGYPNYMQPPNKKMRTTSAIKKRHFCATKNSVDSSSTFVPITPSYEEKKESSISIVIDKATQVDIFKIKTMSEINKHKLRATRCLGKMQQLQEKLDDCNRELYKLKDDCFYNNVKQLIKDAEENNPTAVFIRDLVANYSKKHPNYSEITLQHASIWRLISSKGYEYGRKDVGLPLPSRSTLQKYLGEVKSKDEVGVDNLIEEQIKVEMS